MNKFRNKQFKNELDPKYAFYDCQGKVFATIKVYLNTGIIAGLIGVGFMASAVIFGVLLLVLK